MSRSAGSWLRRSSLNPPSASSAGFSRPLSESPREPLAPEARAQVDALLELVAADETAPTSVTSRPDAERVHVADSLSGLDFPELREAPTICDLGAGAGFPGLVLAAALPTSKVSLCESIGRKCEFMERAIAVMGIANAVVVQARSEEHARGEGEEAYSVVTARAVARLSTLAELASPLLRGGGHLVAWKGRRDPNEEAECERATARTALHMREVKPVGPYAGSVHRHLYLLEKVGATPGDLPRRPGMAKKRPFGA